MNCCKPLLTVRGVTITPTVVTLTVNRLFADLPQNAPFRLCITNGMLPRNNTGTINITDGVLILPTLGWQGNNLRNDSLQNYVCRHAVSPCGCAPVVLDAYRGNDPAHVTIFNRMCASSFSVAEVAPPEILFAAAAKTATKTAKEATA